MPRKADLYSTRQSQV